MKSRNKGQSRVYSLYRRIACFFFAFVMVSMAVMMNSNTSLAAAKETTSKAIAIVFDNSGTMYADTAWSRATYAMEVFASMANEGDQIAIYPMNDIEVDGKTYKGTYYLTNDKSGDEARYGLNSADDIEPLKPLEMGGDPSEVIGSIYTPSSGSTPIETITNAFDGLKSMTADEKWLIVLTDGNNSKEDGFYRLDEDGKAEKLGEDTKDALTDTLTQCNDDSSVNVMYLGIGKDAAEPVISGSSDNVKIASDSKDILTTLTEMCNDIYGRDELELSGGSDSDSYPVTFDISMTKLILFVQGDNIENLRLVDESGSEVETAFSTISPKYPEAPGSGSVKGNIYYKDNATDTSLSGQIATYENVPAGTYTMEFDGNSSDVAVYYEPNVSISAFLTDENGTNVMDLNEGEIYPGTYQLEYGLVDENGNMTDSKLLGDRKFTITYSVNEEEEKVERDDNGSIQIELNAGDQIDARVDATYLNNYHVVWTDSSTEGLSSIEISPTPTYELSADMEADSSYTISDLNDGKADPIVVNVKYNGEKLTTEEMENVKMTLTCDDSNKEDWVEKDSENSRYLIYPKVGTEDAGTHTITADVTYTDEYGEEIQALPAVGNIEFSRYPVWLRWVIIGVILLIILAIILIIMNQKVLPKKMKLQEFDFKVGSRKVTGDAEVSYKGGGRSTKLSITSPTDANGIYCTINISLSAVDPRRTSSRERRVRITGVNPDEFIRTLDVGSASFKRNREGELKRTDIVIDSEDQNGFSAFETGSGWEISMKGKVKAQGSTKDVSLSAIIEHQ